MLLARFPNDALGHPGNFPTHRLLADRIRRANLETVGPLARVSMRKSNAAAPRWRLPAEVEKHFQVNPALQARPGRAQATVTSIMPAKPTPLVDATVPPPEMRRCSLLELDYGQCRWPLGEVHRGRYAVLRRRGGKGSDGAGLTLAGAIGAILAAMPLTPHQRRDLLRIEQGRDADFIALAIRRVLADNPTASLAEIEMMFRAAASAAYIIAGEPFSIVIGFANWHSALGRLGMTAEMNRAVLAAVVNPDQS